jgi:hypothetical protein
VHLHVIGLSRQGKSSFLEHLIRQDIEAGAGVAVIDPHGELYRNMVDWLASREMHRRRRIHLIDPAGGEWSVGFNPLCHDDPNIAARVGAMIDACQKVWEDNESTGHKTLAKLLKMVFETLAWHQLSLREAPLLTTLQHRETRRRLVMETGEAGLIDGWRELDELRPADFVQRFEAVNNRLFDLTRSPGVSTMLGHTEQVLDFKTCMDNGHVVLVNLAHQGKVPPSVAQALGALITADLFHSAQARDGRTAKERPFYCYIDECGDYLNEAIVKGLDQTAKFGLHYVLSHQRLSQLGQRRDDTIRNGVMGGAQSKVVFLQDDEDTTSELAGLLFGKSFDLERPKAVLIKPTTVGYRREWLESEGLAEGSSSGFTNSRAASSGSGTSLSDAPQAEPLNFESESSSETTGESGGRSSVRSTGRHEALVPILQDLPGGVYSLDELKHLAAVEIRLLKKRQAFAYRADDRQARQFATVDVPVALPTPEQAVAFFDSVRGREPSAKRTMDVEAAVAARRRELLGQGARGVLDTDDFFEANGD